MPEDFGLLRPPINRGCLTRRKTAEEHTEGRDSHEIYNRASDQGCWRASPTRLAKLSDMLADKKALTLVLAKRIAAVAEQEAIKNNWNIFIAIVDDGGNLMYLERMDDSQLGSLEVSIAKARSALLFKRPTKALEDSVSAGRIVVMKLSNAVPVEGGLPLMAYGKVVGAIGISGATSPQDGIVAKAGADELENILAGS
jgi:glc operon protein GlcG